MTCCLFEVCWWFSCKLSCHLRTCWWKMNWGFLVLASGLIFTVISWRLSTLYQSDMWMTVCTIVIKIIFWWNSRQVNLKARASSRSLKRALWLLVHIKDASFLLTLSVCICSTNSRGCFLVMIRSGQWRVWVDYHI
jgi:hypothetical protein